MRIFKRLLLWTVSSSMGALLSVNASAQCSADAGANVTICQGASVTLGGSPTAVNGAGGVTYNWNNGAAAVANPVVTPSSTTIYTVNLSNGGCGGESDQITVTVLPSPNANFTFSPNTGCASTPINFTNTTTGCPGCTYDWDFGNPASGTSNASSSQSPSHTFVAIGNASSTFIVTLIVESSNGCTDTQTASITINQTPNAVLTEDVNFTQCLGVNDFYAYFTNASTGTGAGTNYTINYGDGSPNYSSTTAPAGVEHIYSGVNIWTLTYTVTGSNGCSDAQTYEVSNISNPAIGAATLGNTLQCGPVEFCFPLSNYSNNYQSTVYLVDFGDGSPIQTFNHPPPASVCHTYNTSTCANSPQFFTFGITADNNCTPSTATISPIQIFMPPSASFTAPPAACVNSAVPFTNTSIPGFNQGCNSNTNYTWNFGDPASGANNTSTLASPTHVYAAPGTYTVTLNATNSGNPLLACGTTNWTQQVCIEQPPTPVFTVNNNVGCVPMTVQTTNTTANNFASCNTSTTWIVDYSDLPCAPNTGAFSYTGGTNASSLSPQFLLSSVGVYTLRLQMTNSCGVFQDTEAITVNTIPQVLINPISSVCVGTTLTPSAVINGCNLPISSYAWTFASGVPSSSNVQNPGPISYASAGNFNISLTVTNACGPATATTTVSVLAPPNVTALSSAPSNQICAGSSTTLTASGAGSYTWSPATGLSATSGVSVTASPASTTTYTITGTSGSCTDQGSITVTVNPVPVVIPSGMFVMCQGETEQLGVTVNGGQTPYTGYSWNNPATLNNSGIASPVSNATVTTNYTVQVTDSNGCIGIGTVPLTVNNPPLVNAGPDISLCNQPVATTLTGFSPTTGGTGVWSGVGVTPAGVFTPTAVGPITLTYCFQNAATGCSACDNMIITVVNPTAANGGPDIEICHNGAVTQLPLGGTWTGSPMVTPGGLFTPSAIGSATLTFTVGTGSCVQTDQVVVTVLPLPVTTAVADITVCTGTQVQLSANAVSANGVITGYFWSGGTVSNPLIFNPTATPISITTFNVTAVDADGCSGSDQLTVFVNPLPVVNAGPDITLCNQPIPTQLTGTTPAAGGVWSGAGVTPSGVFTPSGLGNTTLTYTYTTPVTNCVASDQMVVTVINPVTANAGPNVSLCVGAPAYQIVPPVLGGIWSPLPVSPAGLFNPTAAGSYTFTYTVGVGTCQTTDQMVIVVNNLPVVNAGPNATICLNESAQLNASVNGGQNPLIYSWTFASTLNNSAIANPVATPLVNTNYTLTVTDGNGCVGTDAVLVVVNGLPLVEAGNNLTLCNQPIPEVLTGFSPLVGGTGTWSGPGITNPTGTFISPGIGSYWLVYEFTAGGNACAASDSILVSVQAPVIANAGQDVSLCFNEAPYQLTGFNPPVGGVWSGAGVTNTANGVFNPQSAGVGTHILTIVFGTGTCFSTDQMEMEVLPLPAVNTGNDVVVCGNANPFNQVGFVPANGGIWEGPGVTNAATGNFDPAIGTGSYTLLFWYTAPLTGCADSSTITVDVSPVPVAGFTLPVLGCTDAAATLDNTSQGATQYDWDFGNGFTTTGFEPSYTYPDEGNYSVTLTASNAFGCEDATSLDNEIIDPPLSDFSVSPADGCAPLQVSFTNESIGQYTSFDWSLAIATSDLQNPAPLTYPQGADVVIYPISLTVTNFCGASLDEDEVTVYPQPVAGFGTDLDIFCSPFTVNFNNNSVGNPDTFTWDFGDGGPFSFLEEPGSHVFFADSVAVDYTIWLYLSNECGLDTADYTITVLPNTVTSFFNTNVTWGCAPLTVEFTDFSDGGNQIQYDFGGGNFTGNPDPIYTFANAGDYTVFQYVDNGCSYDTSSITITVYPSPILDFDIDAPFACEGSAVQFTSSPGNAVSIEWDFGDGGTSYLSNPAYVFTSSGTFTVEMTGTGNNGCTASVSQAFTTYPAPVTSFTIPNQVGCSPFTACFSNTSVGGQFYTWDLGNGNTSNLASPCIIYENFGSQPFLQTVSLITQNLQLCADTMTMNVIVSPQPTSLFTLNASESCYFPVTASINNLSSDASGYEWFVNSQLESTLANPSFTFDEVGLYQIELVAGNQFGCSHTSQNVFTVYPLPEAGFEADEFDGCVDLLVQFTNTSIGAESVLWLFGDGSSAIADSPSHLYTAPGVFDVSLVVTTENGCQDTLVYADYIEAFNLPVADFIFNPEETTIYDPTFTFIDQSYDAQEWLWNFGDGTTSTFENIQHYYNEAGAWPVTLRVWNEHGCTDLASDIVRIEDIFNIYVPNTFTPDEDDINEVFLPQMSGTRFIEKYTLQIYDRWGTVIFETNNPEEPWAGDVREGDYYAKDESYNWQVIVQLKGVEKPRIYAGHVFLLR